MSPSPELTLLYFAAASTTLNTTSEKITLPYTPFPLSSLGSLLSSIHSDKAMELSKVLGSSQWSVDAEMVDSDKVEEVKLNGGEEVAVICPVSGG
ncbi:hypothetical protein K474DRAFT_368315 [Panus rudis PR-1116 ss-1]|nr:hypothetical protein K474DRAFT_368315 [Panus rudis PR-1116 ss-1]